MRRRVTLISIAVLLCGGVAMAWFAESRVSSASPAGYHVAVVRDGQTLANFDLTALKAVGMIRVTAQGQPQQGPAVISVLSSAGVTDFARLTVVGLGVRDKGRLVLSRGKIGPDVVLAVSKRGTVKLAGPSIPQDQRVRDVTELLVR